MITPATCWKPLPGALGRWWEGSDSGLVRRTSAAPGFEGFVGRLKVPVQDRKQAAYKILHKRRCTSLSVRRILSMHGLAEDPSPDWLTQARVFVEDYNRRLDAGEEVGGHGGAGEVCELSGGMGDGEGSQGDQAGAGLLPALPDMRGQAGEDQQGEQTAPATLASVAQERASKAARNAQRMCEKLRAEQEAREHARLAAVKPASWPARYGFEDRLPDFGLGF